MNDPFFTVFSFAMSGLAAWGATRFDGWWTPVYALCGLWWFLLGCAWVRREIRSRRVTGETTR